MKKSYLIATAMIVAIAVWMLLGTLRDEALGGGGAAPDTERVTVETRKMRAENIELSLTLQGDVEPHRAVTVRAETAGRVASVGAAEGEFVDAGDLLVQLEMDDRAERLEESKARLEERQQAYERAKRLKADNFQAQSSVDEAYAQLKTAEADLARIRLDIAHTRIRAPFAGILATRRVEVGDYVGVNGDIASFVDNRPLIVAVPVAQQDVGGVSRGAQAAVTFATGARRAGKVRYIAPRADPATRTFRVEVEVDNADGGLPSGISAEVHIPTGQVVGHLLSPALLTLNNAGEMGVKTVDASGVVVFHRVDIVRAGTEGIWVSGLPETAEVITVGQGYVREGEVVDAVPMEEAQSMRISDTEMDRMP